MYTMIKVVDSVSHKQTTNAEGKQFEGENLSLLLANFNKSYRTIQLHLIMFVRKILSNHNDSLDLSRQRIYNLLVFMGKCNAVKHSVHRYLQYGNQGFRSVSFT